VYKRGNENAGDLFLTSEQNKQAGNVDEITQVHQREDDDDYDN